MRHTLVRAQILLSTLAALSGWPSDAWGQAQTGTVTGRISDRGTGEAIPGARVFVFGTAQAATARQDGSYRLQLRAGRHELRVAFIGYGLSRDTVQVTAGQSLTQDFQLAREPLALEELAVIGTRAAERTSTEAAVPVDVFTAAEIKQSGRTETTRSTLAHSE